MGPLSIEKVLAEEAAAIHDPSDVNIKVIVDRLQALATGQRLEDDRADKDADERSGDDEDRIRVIDRKAFYCELGKLKRAAICCSGGGIRSATFCLGIIQALAQHGLMWPPITRGDVAPRPDELKEDANNSLLSRFHYLSTVSGGGYIGSWLSAWRQRNDFPTVWQNLSSRPDGPDVEPPEISWLRAYSNYLTPKTGIFSADTWTDIVIYLRNLILNWLVIVPAVAVILLVLKALITGSVAIARLGDIWWPHLLTALLGVVCLVVAQAFTTKYRPTRRAPPKDKKNDPSNVDQKIFQLGDLVWSVASAILVTSALTSSVGVTLAGSAGSFGAILIGAILGVPIFAAGWLAGHPYNWSGNDLFRWAASGLVYGGLVVYGAHLYSLMNPYSEPPKDTLSIILVPVILGVPWILLSQMLADMVFVGLVSYEKNSDADREWLGRASGWVAASAIIWILTTFITFAGGYFLVEVAGPWIASSVAAAGGISGIVVAWLGKSGTATKAKADDQGEESLVTKIAMVVAGPLFAAVLVVGISVGLDLLLLGDSLIGGLTKRLWTTGHILWWLSIGFVAAFSVAAIASRNVNINRFSIHALYRNRLVRAYLGASRQKRYPDKFTGFDNDDNLPCHALWPPAPYELPGYGKSNTFCLFHVLNITLNVVKTARLAWQQRKAESFTVSPLHCGTAFQGYRPSKEYAGPGKPFGISLGTAMAISGAAANPNMGYNSSPSITLLLALFNVRLGWWLGNPGKAGETTYKEEGPITAIRPLAEEAFGLTTDRKPWVNLSDGGHFENLGIYEMVRRRCRFILAIDAGCDPKFAFEDLGNAIRKIYIDLGIRIRFEELDKLKNRPTEQEVQEAEAVLKASPGYDPSKLVSPIPYYAIGVIDYRNADGAQCENGLILYVKPAYHGTSKFEGAGVRSYATASPTFPHESTADQWFSESQFESYRSLALDIARTVMRGQAVLPIQDAAGKVTTIAFGDYLKTLAPTAR